MQYLPELGRVGYYPYQATSSEFPGYHGSCYDAPHAPHRLPSPALTAASFPSRPPEGSVGSASASPTCIAGRSV